MDRSTKATLPLAIPGLDVSRQSKSSQIIGQVQATFSTKHVRIASDGSVLGALALVQTIKKDKRPKRMVEKRAPVLK